LCIAVDRHNVDIAFAGCNEKGILRDASRHDALIGTARRTDDVHCGTPEALRAGLTKLEAAATISGCS